MRLRREKDHRFFVSATQDGVREVRPFYKSDGALRQGQRHDPHPRARRWREKAENVLDSYFSGRVRRFSIPCDLQGLTPFTHAVLKITCRIPYGEVRSYRWIAESVGRPKAARAVGNALARNPVPILIPCHRVVRSNGSLGGYALGSKWKKMLLEMENKHARRLQS